MAEGATCVAGGTGGGAYGRRNGQTGVPRAASHSRPHRLRQAARDAVRRLPDDGGNHDADTQRQMLQCMDSDGQRARPAPPVAQRVADDDQGYDGKTVPLRGDVLRQLREVFERLIF